MRLVVRSLVVFFLLLPLSAAQNDLYITVGTFKNKGRADAQLVVLKNAMEQKADMARLQRKYGFKYTVEKRDDFNLVVITPFEDIDVLQSVIDSARETFPDAFARRYKTPPTPVQSSRQSPVKKTAPRQAPEPRPEPKSVPDVEKTPTIVPVEVVEDETQETLDELQPIVPYIQETSTPTSTTVSGSDSRAASGPAPDEVLAGETVDIVTFDEHSADQGMETDQGPDTLPARSNVILYALLAGLIALLLIIMVWVLRRSKAKKELKEPFAFNEKVISPHDVKAPSKKEEKSKGEVVAPPHKEKQQTPKVPDLAVPTTLPETSPEEETRPEESKSEPVAEVKAVPTRKRREPSSLNVKMRKDDLKEFSGNRLLVAEDNLINQKVIISLLAGSGIEVVIANNGQEALDILQKDRDFQMILMDAHMPVKDGYQAAQDIRDEPAYDHIPIVALSGDTSPDDIRRMKKVGMEEQLSKPLRIDALYNVMYCYFDIDTSENEVAAEDSGMQDTDSLKISQGIEISGGDVDLYKEVLAEFVETYGSSDHTLDGYFVHDDIESAKALLLDIRGIAANIGAEVLSETAEELREAILDESEVKYNALFEKYREQLYFLINDIKAI